MEEVLRQAPTLQTNAAQFLLDSRMRPVRFTAAARSFDNQGWYLGTSGLGLFYLQDATAIPERVPFGLPSQFVAAVMSWPGGVWVATNRTAQADAAFTFVESALREFRTVRGLRATGTPFTRVLELAGQDRSLWAATDFGLVRMQPAEDRIELFDEGRGLPDSRVYAVAGRQGRIVVGTARGLARMDDSLSLTRVAPLFADAAYAVFPAGDSIWVGTPRGVFVAVPGDQDLVRPEGLASASLQVPVFGFSTLGDTLVALTRDHMMWRDPRAPAWSIGPNLSGLLGRLRRFAPDGPGFWVAGERGVGFARLDGAPARTLREGDLPGSRERPRGGSRPPLGRDRGRTGPLPARRHPSVSRGSWSDRGSALGPGAEFDRIRRIARALGDRARGLGDDCALLPDDGGALAVSTDLSVEGVHFRLEWIEPAEAGWRAVAGGAVGPRRGGRAPDRRALRRYRPRRRAGRGSRGARRRHRCGGGGGGRRRGRRRPVRGPGVEHDASR